MQAMLKLLKYTFIFLQLPSLFSEWYYCFECDKLAVASDTGFSVLKLIFLEESFNSNESLYHQRSLANFVTSNPN